MSLGLLTEVFQHASPRVAGLLTKRFRIPRTSLTEQKEEAASSLMIWAQKSYSDSLITLYCLRNSRACPDSREGTWSLLLSGEWYKKSTAAFPNCHTHFTDRKI